MTSITLDQCRKCNHYIDEDHFYFVKCKVKKDYIAMTPIYHEDGMAYVSCMGGDDGFSTLD